MDTTKRRWHVVRDLYNRGCLVLDAAWAIFADVATNFSLRYNAHGYHCLHRTNEKVLVHLDDKPSKENKEYTGTVVCEQSDSR